MSKYFSKRDISLMQKTENERRSSESFFSSKEGDNFFGNVKDALKVVGIEHVKANGSVGAFNVVKFNDGHQMSTSKFFSARGLQWPVGGNVAKLNYLASALENEVTIEVTPQDVKVTPMQRRDGTFVGPRDEKTGKTTTAKDAKSALQAVTYYFEPQELPAVEMVNWEEEE